MERYGHMERYYIIQMDDKINNLLAWLPHMVEIK
jgi:hypothetical protein